MSQGMKYTVFSTPFGWITCLGSVKGLRKMTLPQLSPQQSMDLIGEEIDSAEHDPDFFDDVIQQVLAYFNGEETAFNIKLDYGDATPFQKAVWEAAREIPFGQTESYGGIARRIKKPGATRAVGTTLGKNPLPLIVPCHRIIGANGGLCGFGGGLAMKEALLTLEKTTD
jgi:methylated-DNA-[protein]-cysteine S-methyltransferase